MNRGSAKFEVETEIVDAYLQTGHTLRAIAGFLGTTYKTFRLWCIRNNYSDNRGRFDDDVVDDIITEFLEGQPLIGETQIIGHVKGNYDIHGTRAQYRASIARCDVDNLRIRKAQFGKVIIRRVYDIKGPHKLWHLDGWHKLIRYMMVVFGCIDGGTRALIYCAIKTNNKAVNHLR
jgi:hypothetical protein